MADDSLSVMLVNDLSEVPRLAARVDEFCRGRNIPGPLVSPIDDRADPTRALGPANRSAARRRRDPLSCAVLREGIGAAARVVATGRFARDRIGELLIRERKHAFRVEVILPVALRSAGLPEPVVDLIAAAAAGVAQNPVQDAAAVFVLVEAEIHEVVQRARRLRDRRTLRRCVRTFFQFLDVAAGLSLTLNQSPLPSFVLNILKISSYVNGRAPRRPKTEI